MTDRPHPLGRRVAIDPRDRDYPMTRLLAAAERTEGYQYWWSNGGWHDQGAAPTCVGAATWHWLVDGPLTGNPGVGPDALYALAQEHDEWPGSNYAGTSVRGAAKALAAAELATSYWWAWDLDTLVVALLNRGPVVVGTNWYWQMFFPDPQGAVEVTGPLEGGHAYVANGVNTATETIRFKNSWGRSWGRRGYFYMRFDDCDRLIREDGEAMIAIEARH